MVLFLGIKVIIDPETGEKVTMLTREAKNAMMIAMAKEVVMRPV